MPEEHVWKMRDGAPQVDERARGDSGRDTEHRAGDPRMHRRAGDRSGAVEWLIP